MQITEKFKIMKPESEGVSRYAFIYILMLCCGSFFTHDSIAQVSGAINCVGIEFSKHRLYDEGEYNWREGNAARLSQLNLNYWRSMHERIDLQLSVGYALLSNYEMISEQRYSSGVIDYAIRGQFHFFKEDLRQRIRIDPFVNTGYRFNYVLLNHTDQDYPVHAIEKRNGALTHGLGINFIITQNLVFRPLLEFNLNLDDHFQHAFRGSLGLAMRLDRKGNFLK